MKPNIFSAIRQHRAAIDATRKLENMRASSMKFDESMRELPIEIVLHKVGARIEADPYATGRQYHVFANSVSREADVRIRQADKLAREVA